MSNSRLILAGVLAVAVAAIAYLLAPGESPDALAKNGQPPRTLIDETRPDQPMRAEVAENDSARQKIARRVPASESSSAFVRRQELERGGYDAGRAGHAAALKRLAEITAPGDRAAFIRGMFASFRENGAQEVLAALKQIPNETERRTALRALVEARQFEAPAALSHVDGRDGSHRLELESIEVMASGNALKARVSGEQSSLILSLSDSPDLAVGLARELVKGPELGSLLAEIARREVGQNPTRALSFGEGLEGKAREDFLARVASGWGEADGAAAWAWALGQSDPGTRESMQEAVIRGMAAGNPKTAAENAAQMSEGKARQRSMDVVGQIWGGKDTKEALDWANALPSQADRDQALASIRQSAPVGIGAMLSTDPEGYPVIQDVIAGGAASELPQLAKGSRIASVRDASGNVVDLKGMNLQEAVSLLRGAPGTSVTLEVIPSGGTFADRRPVVVTRRQLLRKG